MKRLSSQPKAKSATNLFHWRAPPRYKKAKQISFAINYELLILAPRSDATLELFFHLGNLKVLFSISRRINFIRKL